MGEQKAQCIGTKQTWSRNRYARGWYQSAEPRQCKNDARPGFETCLYRRDATETIHTVDLSAMKA